MDPPLSSLCSASILDPNSLLIACPLLVSSQPNLPTKEPFSLTCLEYITIKLERKEAQQRVKRKNAFFFPVLQEFMLITFPFLKESNSPINLDLLTKVQETVVAKGLDMGWQHDWPLFTVLMCQTYLCLIDVETFFFDLKELNPFKKQSSKSNETVGAAELIKSLLMVILLLLRNLWGAEILWSGNGKQIDEY